MKVLKGWFNIHYYVTARNQEIQNTNLKMNNNLHISSEYFLIAREDLFPEAPSLKDKNIPKLTW